MRSFAPRLALLRPPLLTLTLGLVAAAGCKGDAPEATNTAPAKAAKAAEQPEESPSFAETAPAVGDPAPDFTLASLGGDPVTLSTITADGPTVLVFGSYS